MPSDRLRAIIATQNEIAATALDVDAVMALVARRARELVAAAAGVIELVDGDDMLYRVTSGTADACAGLRIPAEGSLSGLCVALGEALYCEDADGDSRVDGDACRRVGARSMVCLPLRHDGAVVGVLKVYDPAPHAFDGADLQTLELLSGIIAAHMAHATQYQDQEHASLHDALTGLPNRRCFDERLVAEGARVRRQGGIVSLCLLDLDRFKEVNDTHGHRAGDDVLRAVARHLAAMRGEDGAYRVGGDEFALILVGAAASRAEEVARRIADAIAADPECRAVGVSWGVATLSPGDPESVVAKADAALYAAKHAAAEPARR